MRNMLPVYNTNPEHIHSVKLDNEKNELVIERTVYVQLVGDSIESSGCLTDHIREYYGVVDGKIVLLETIKKQPSFWPDRDDPESI